MDSLIAKHNVVAVREALQTMPRGVEDTYDEAMERITGQNEDDKELAKRILSWVTFAHRPLKVEELQHALAIIPDMTHIDPDSIINEDILSSVCAGLIILDEHVRLVRKYFD
jgi:hypothetical protein